MLSTLVGQILLCARDLQDSRLIAMDSSEQSLGTNGTTVLARFQGLAA